MTPEALLLDFDGTLVDWTGALEAGVHAAAAQVARLHGLDAAEVAARTLAFEAEVFELHATGWTLGGVGAPELGLAIWRRLLGEYGLDDDPAEFLAAAQWQAEIAAYRAYDDVTALIDGAQAAGIRLALVTNGPSSVQRAKLERVGLTDAFDALLISAEVGVAKPDTGIFEAALEALGSDPAQVWHVGDSLEYDIAGAQAAGVGSVWINRNGWTRGRHQPEPDREITTLGELTQLLERAA
ncbi:HAD family hydrolase [Gryllotalpicola protaetiae]|uniref:HAD family hydrolase n=1 Tax=Gryllotalpicola protaetiae TaxID=2419771 RepID=A0A387BMH5_9MICO|nr:HAD family hydrolase [Gryllotalpicola protaetiae]AYG02226.1 HAD family hydrolase [Gryllotalpicola protaetiae]